MLNVKPATNGKFRKVKIEKREIKELTLIEGVLREFTKKLAEISNNAAEEELKPNINIEEKEVKVEEISCQLLTSDDFCLFKYEIKDKKVDIKGTPNNQTSIKPASKNQANKSKQTIKQMSLN